MNNMKESEKIHIVACLDKNFTIPSFVMIYSTCVNNPEVDIDFHIITDESVTETNKKDLQETISVFKGKSVFFYSLDYILTNSFPIIKKNHLSRAAYYRLFISEILPTTIEKVLYIDGDCIVRHSLQQLWHIDITDYAIGAAFDSLEGYSEYYDRLGYPSNLGYFNSGVLLINLYYWRSHGVIKDCVQYIQKNAEKIIWADQDVMNVVLQKSKLSIPIKYNLQTGILKDPPCWDYQKYKTEVEEGIKNPVIVHFTGSNKPWNKYCIFPHPYSSTFYKYLNQTKWKGHKYDRRSMKKKIRNFIGDSLRWMNILKRSLYIDVTPID